MKQNQGCTLKAEIMSHSAAGTDDSEAVCHSADTLVHAEACHSDDSHVPADYRVKRGRWSCSCIFSFTGSSESSVCGKRLQPNIFSQDFLPLEFVSNKMLNFISY